MSQQATMSRPARYLFDEVFAVDVQRPRESSVSREQEAAAREAAVEAARREGYERGRAEALGEAAASGEARLEETVQRLVALATELSAGLQETGQRMETDAAALAVTVARKLAPALVSREPSAEIETLLRRCLGELRDTPHVVARVAEEIVAPLQERSKALCGESGFAGALVILGDPDIAPGDGRVDWADGGIVRDSAAMQESIDAAVADFVAARAAAPASKEKTDV